jgi:hypothetical protein
MALPRSNHSGLMEALDCAIVLEERLRLGLIAPSDLAVRALDLNSQGMVAASFTERARMAIRGRA